GENGVKPASNDIAQSAADGGQTGRKDRAARVHKLTPNGVWRKESKGHQQKKGTDLVTPSPPQTSHHALDGIPHRLSPSLLSLQQIQNLCIHISGHGGSAFAQGVLVGQPGGFLTQFRRKHFLRESLALDVGYYRCRGQKRC